MAQRVQVEELRQTMPVLYVAGEHVPMIGLSQEEILVRFRSWMRLDIADGKASEETIRAYFCDVRQHLEWLAKKGLVPGELGELDLRAYRAELVEQYAMTTVARKLTGIRRFYEMAQARGMMAHNPAAGLKAPQDKTERYERVKYLTQMALGRVLNAPDRQKVKGRRDLAILTLMAMHGLRVIEIQRLGVDDLDPEAGEAGALQVLGKGNKRRIILLTEETRALLNQWLDVRQSARPSSGAMFVSMHWGIRQTARYRQEPGGRMSRRAIRKMVDGYLEQIGAKRPGVSCHSLRHSYATHALANGASLLAISQSMGHASVATTQVYAKIVDRARNNPAKFLVGLLDDENGACE